MKLVVTSLLSIMLLLAGIDAYAQKTSGYSGVWRNRVIWRIHFDSTAANAKEWMMFIEKMTKSIEKGKLKAISTYSMDSALTPVRLVNMLKIEPDTILIDSPTMNVPFLKITEHQFDYSKIQGIALEEEWICDPATGQTQIHITHIAPLRFVYDEDGIYRGSRAFFWLKWRDFRNYCSVSGNNKIFGGIAGMIWTDYIDDGPIDKNSITTRFNKANNVWEGRLKRWLHLRGDTMAYSEHKLNRVYYNSMCEVLYDSIIAGKIKAYKEAPGNTESGFKKLFRRPEDTVVTYDKKLGTEIQTITYYEPDSVSIENNTDDRHAVKDSAARKKAVLRNDYVTNTIDPVTGTEGKRITRYHFVPEKAVEEKEAVAARTPLKNSEIKELTEDKIDTFEVSDPSTGTSSHEIMHRSFDFDYVNVYNIKEAWLFNADKGTTEITIAALTPTIDSYIDGVYSPNHISLFWVKYRDARSSLQRYNEYNPDLTLEKQLWDSRFSELGHRWQQKELF